MSIVPGVRLDELADELESLNNANSEGFTAREMAKHYDRTPRWAREKLQILVEANRVVFVGRRLITRIDGIANRVPVYKIVAKE